jgi:glyoxylase-like metal-dependent hydrolase (beta-lactamase superfamily II)
VRPAILSPAFLFLAASLQAQPKPQYEIYAVRYATIPGFAVSGLIEGADPSRKLDIAMMVWLIRGNGKNILFDSGFHAPRYIQQWHPVDFSTPAEAVARAGVKPEEVTDVVISHMHWDHAGGLDLFPKAKIWLQKDELEYYAGSAWQSRRTHGGIDADDVQTAVKLNTEGRVGLIDGDGREFLPGITAYTGGKHTYASQFIAVNTAGGTVVLASDNMYLYENLEKHLPIAQTKERAACNGYEKLPTIFRGGVIDETCLVHGSGGDCDFACFGIRPGLQEAGDLSNRHRSLLQRQRGQ